MTATERIPLKTVATVLVSALLVLSAGCRNDSSSSRSTTLPPTVAPATSAAAPPVQAPSPSPTPTRNLADPNALRHWFTIKYKTDDGYTSSASGEVGRVESYDDVSSTTNVAPGSACTIDQQTVGVVPYQITLTNTTISFTHEVFAPFVYGYNVQFEEDYSDGPNCVSGGSALTAQLAPGASSETDGYLLISGYFSPNHPTGDKSLTKNVIGAASDLNDESEYVHIKNATGPGVSNYFPGSAGADLSIPSH